MMKQARRVLKLGRVTFLVSVIAGIFLADSSRGANKDVGWKTYRDKALRFEIKYPEKLIHLSKENQRLKLLHSIPFEHPDPCEADDVPDPPLSELVDFNVSVEMLDKNLKGAVLWYEASAYEYFLARFTSDNVLTIAPGYIDTVGIGSLKGYRIWTGVEGCGLHKYYFPLDSAHTLFVERYHITELNPIIINYKENRKLPGVITPEKEEELFNQILSTFKFRK